MDEEREKAWKKVVKDFEGVFGPDLDIQAIIFLIGVQELGKGPQDFSKNEKLELMHIAICRILSPYGFYELEGRDEDGWPHYKTLKSLPHLNAGDQLKLMKKGIIKYVEEENFFN
jgi:hypothetical protein